MLNSEHYQRDYCDSDEQFKDYTGILTEAINLGCDYEFLTDWIDNTIMYTRWDTVLESPDPKYQKFCVLYNDYNTKYR